MLVGPSVLEIIAAVNTANDDLRRALSGQLGFCTDLSSVFNSSWLPSNSHPWLLARPNTSTPSRATDWWKPLCYKRANACDINLQAHVVSWMLWCMSMTHHWAFYCTRRQDNFCCSPLLCSALLCPALPCPELHQPTNLLQICIDTLLASIHPIKFMTTS